MKCFDVKIIKKFKVSNDLFRFHSESETRIESVDFPFPSFHFDFLTKCSVFFYFCLYFHCFLAPFQSYSTSVEELSRGIFQFPYKYVQIQLKFITIYHEHLLNLGRSTEELIIHATNHLRTVDGWKELRLALRISNFLTFFLF